MMVDVPPKILNIVNKIFSWDILIEIKFKDIIIWYIT